MVLYVKQVFYMLKIKTGYDLLQTPHKYYFSDLYKLSSKWEFPFYCHTYVNIENSLFFYVNKPFFLNG